MLDKFKSIMYYVLVSLRKGLEMFEVIFEDAQWRVIREARFATRAEAFAAGWAWLTEETEGRFDVTNLDRLGHDGAWLGTYDKDGEI